MKEWPFVDALSSLEQQKLKELPIIFTCGDSSVTPSKHFRKDNWIIGLNSNCSREITVFSKPSFTSVVR